MGSELPTTRRRSWEWYCDRLAAAKRVAPEYAREVEAALGRHDLFYLLVRILRREDVNRDWLFARCREVQAAPDGYLDLWAREHYKSTIITFGLTIQDILRDSEVTIGIFSHTRPIAKGFLSQIKREFEDNEILKWLYPDVLWANPAKDAPKWSEDGGLIVRRKGNPKEATVEAHGLVDGQPTSRHFSLRVYDDVVTRESVTSPEMVAKTTDAWDLSQNLGTADGRVRMIGTRYSLFDTYATVIDRRAATPRIHAATHNARMDGRPVFFTVDHWQEKLRTSSRTIIASQQLQNPMADESATFLPQWLRAYEVRPRTLNVGIMGDPSRGRTATSDNTAIAVIGVASSGAKYLLDGVCHQMTLSQRWQSLRTLYRRWSAAGVCKPSSSAGSGSARSRTTSISAEQMELDHKAKVANAFFTINELSWPREGGNSKRERIERLEPDFRNGRFFLPSPIMQHGKPCTWLVDRDPQSKTFGAVEFPASQGLTKTQMAALEGGSPELLAKAINVRDPLLPGPRATGGTYDLTRKFIEDYLIFPFGRHDDLLDAASRIYDMEVHAPVGPSTRVQRMETYVDGV